VAEDGVADIRREGGKTFIVTTDDSELPVSRTYLSALRNDGVIKRFS
jgi:DNA-binding LytR/AlgR family response regulator